MEQQEQKGTDPSVLGVLGALPQLVWHSAQTQCPGCSELKVEMKLHAYSEPFGSDSYHFVDDCDEELMDQWSLIKVIEWHNFFLLSPRDTKSHHGTVTMNISKMVLSSFPSFLMAVFV